MATYEKHSNVNIWWFPQDFCQSRYGEHRSSGTNSCTLISLLLADKMAKENLFRVSTHKLPPRAVEIFADAMNQGNIVYSRIFKGDEENFKKRTPNLNIPEAITALTGEEFIEFDLQEWFYTHLTANPQKETYKITVPQRITKVLNFGIQLFKQPQSNSKSRNLFAAIIADSRTTVFVIDFANNVVSFFDSHQHGHQTGAVVAQSSLDNLPDLIQWFVSMVNQIYHSQPSIFEISFLTTSADAPNLTNPQSII